MDTSPLRGRSRRPPPARRRTTMRARLTRTAGRRSTSRANSSPDSSASSESRTAVTVAVRSPAVRRAISPMTSPRPSSASSTRPPPSALLVTRRRPRTTRCRESAGAPSRRTVVPPGTRTRRKAATRASRSAASREAKEAVSRSSSASSRGGIFSEGGRPSHHRRLLRRSRPLREALRAVRGDGDDVLVADAHLPRDVDPRLVGEAHAGAQGGAVGAHEVGPLVAVHADAVAQTMGEELVVGAEARLLDHAAGGRVHGLRLQPLAGGGEARLLRAPHDVPDAALAIGGGGAEHARARDVARVAEQAPASVDEDHVAPPQGPRARGGMGEG